MRILSIFDEEKRRRHLFSFRKRIGRIGKPVVKTTPIFVLGKQRSSTTILFNFFERSQDTETYNENNGRILQVFNCPPISEFPAGKLS